MSPSGDCHLSECDVNMYSTASNPKLVRSWSEIKLHASHMCKISTLYINGKVLFYFFTLIIPENFHIASDYVEALLNFLKISSGCTRFEMILLMEIKYIFNGHGEINHPQCSVV